MEGGGSVGDHENDHELAFDCVRISFIGQVCLHEGVLILEIYIITTEVGCASLIFFYLSVDCIVPDVHMIFTCELLCTVFMGICFTQVASLCFI